jgi:hypothetical protein
MGRKFEYAKKQADALQVRLPNARVARLGMRATLCDGPTKQTSSEK